MPYNAMLEEICKASTMRAATALSKFLNVPFKINIKPVEITSIDKIKLPYYNNKDSIGLYVGINGHILKGGSSLLIPQDSGYDMCDILLKRDKGSTHALNEIEESALKEMMNIVLGNFLTSFAHSLLTSSLMHTPAIIEKEPPLDIIKHIRNLLLESTGTNNALNISFSYENGSLKGDFNIVFESEKTLSLLNKVMVLANG